jgi:plasmid maintenance system antidote protein VapI
MVLVGLRTPPWWAILALCTDSQLLALTNLITGKAGISPEMALRIDLAFGGGAETWLQRQLLHDLAQARKRLAELNVVSVASERQTALF